MWMVSIALGLVAGIAVAEPQRLRPGAAAVDPGEIRSLQSGVAELRSQVRSLQRANDELERKMAAFARQAAEDPHGARARGPSPIEMPTRDQVSETRSALEFSQDVMRIVEPRLAALDDRLTTLEARHDGHVHEYIKSAGMGWANWETIEGFHESCSSCTYPFRDSANASRSGSGYLETSKPRD